MRLLFITSNSLGDVVLSTGLLARLIEEHEPTEVTVVCGKIPAPLFRAMPGVTAIIPVQKQKYARHWLSVYGQLIGKRWDLMVDLRNVAIMKLLPARRKIPGPRGRPDGHKLKELAQLIGAADVPPPAITLDEAAKKKAVDLIPEGSPVIGLCPVTGPGIKHWRGDKYAAVITALTAPDGALPGARVAVLGAPVEREPANKVIDLLKGVEVLDLVGKTDPLEAAAALARCDIYIGADSGLMHLAAVMDIPTLGLFGERGVPQTYRPWGTHTAHVHQRNPDWDRSDKPSAMDGIQIDQVITTATELLARSRARSRG